MRLDRSPEVSAVKDDSPEAAPRQRDPGVKVGSLPWAQNTRQPGDRLAPRRCGVEDGGPHLFLLLECLRVIASSSLSILPSVMMVTPLLPFPNDTTQVAQALYQCHLGPFKS